MSQTVKAILAEIEQELDKAMRAYAPIASLHEGYAVIKEELDEAWEEIKKAKTSHALTAEQREELIQVAAMAVRTIADIERLEWSRAEVIQPESCPVCGSDVKIVEFRHPSYASTFGNRCSKNGCILAYTTNVFNSTRRAIEGWNNRVAAFKVANQ